MAPDRSEEHVHVQYYENKVIVNFLPSDMTAAQLADIFRYFGRPVNKRWPSSPNEIVVELPMHSDRNLGNKSYGFVVFASREITDDAIRRINGLAIGNKKIKVSRARVPTEDIKGTNLYVWNMPASWGDEQMRTYFTQPQVCPGGTVVTAHVVPKRQEQEDEFSTGYVRFSHCQEVDFVLRYHEPGNSCIQVEPAPRESRAWSPNTRSSDSVALQKRLARKKNL